MSPELAFFGAVWHGATDWVYNAATGKLTDAQKAAIVQDTDDDIDRGAGGNTELADAQKEQWHREAADVFAQSDAQAEAGSLFGIGGLGDLGTQISGFAKKYLPWVLAAIFLILFGPALLEGLAGSFRRR